MTSPSTGPCTPLGGTCVGAEIPDDACRVAVDMASAIVAGAITKLTTFWCEASEGCQGIHGMVTHGLPFVWPGMPYGVLAVWLDELTIVGTSKPTYSAPATFMLELWLPGFPTVTSGGLTGTEFVAPSPALRDNVGRVSTAIAETLANAVAAVLRQRQCATWKIGRVRPKDTGSDVKGWEARIEVDLATVG